MDELLGRNEVNRVTKHKHLNEHLNVILLIFTLSIYSALHTAVTEPAQWDSDLSLLDVIQPETVITAWTIHAMHQSWHVIDQ